MLELSHTYRSLLALLRERSKLEAFCLVVCLFGPFIFLIERSPSDIWIVLVDIAFLIRCTFKGDWRWMHGWWPRSVFCFWAAMFLAAFLSPTPIIALTEAAIWIRFPLLAFAFAFWLANYPVIVRSLLVMTAIGLALMMLTLTAELYVTYDKWSSSSSMSARLSWPFGDPVSGNYIAKFGLVAVVWASASLSSRNLIPVLFGGAAAGMLLLFIVLTGERINSLIVFCTIGLTLLWLNHRRKIFLTLILPCLTCIGFFAVSRSNYLNYKFTVSFFDGLFDYRNSGYIQLWKTGLEMFKTNPLTGAGPGMFRFLCDQIIYADRFIPRCDNHPHQYYIQVLAETGVIGFTTFVIMVSGLIYMVWANGRYSGDLLKKSCFIVPLALFFPLQSTADIFGQWVNSMMWYSVSLALAISLVKDAGQKKQSNESTKIDN